MKKLLIGSARIVTIMSLLTACGIEDHPKNVELPDNVSVIPEPEAPAPEVPEEFSDVTATSLKVLSNFPVGVAVPGSLFSNTEQQELVLKHFSQLSSENDMKMDAMHPSENTFSFTKADELIGFAEDNDLTVHGHVLVWHSQIPDWMRDFSGDTAAWVAMMENHVTTIATNYTGRLETWDVVNEAFLDNGEYRGAKTTTQGDDASVWYENIGAEFIPLAFTAARAADPDADLYYNDFNLIWSSDKLGAVINMVNNMQADGVPIDGIGFQSHITVNSPGIATIRAQFQKVVDIRPKIKLKITELDVRMNNPDEIGTKVTTFTAARAEDQKQYYHDIVEAYLDIVPADQRGGITVWGIVDGDSWLQSFPAPTVEWPLLFNDDLTPKPALQGFADALIEADLITDVPDVPDTAFFNTDFETALDSWGSRGDATVTLSTDEAHVGTNSALVAGRTANWQGISKSVVGLFTAGESYNVSAWVKLSDDASTVTPSMKLTLEINHGTGDGATEYLEMTTPVTVSAGDWVELTGTYTHTITTVANSANLYVEASETTVDFYVDDISIALEVGTPDVPNTPDPEVTAFFNTNFETDLDSWGSRGDATVTLATDEAHAGNNSALAVGRTANWQGVSKSVVGLFTAGESYNVSAWVKLSDDASTVTPSMKLTLEINHGAGDGTTEYLEMTTPVTVSAGDWVELTGTYAHTITTVANSANLYVEGSETTVDFYVDDISITLVE